MAGEPLRCLFVSPVVPYPPDSGGRIRTYRLLRELGARAELHLRAVIESAQAAAHLKPLEPYCASVRGFPRAPSSPWRRTTRPKLERWFYSAALVSGLRAELERGRFDLVHLDEMCLARAIDRHGRTPVVVHHHKLDTVLHELLPQKNRLGKAFDLFKLRRLEAAAAQRFRFHVLTSVEDQAALLARYPALETCVVESGFDPGYFQPVDAPRESDSLLFLGSLDYAPNIDALQWFVRDVLPLIGAQRRGVRLRVVGSAPVPQVRALAGEHVDVVGGVDDVRPHLASASALVVPLRIGGGTRIKIVEALGCELPVVSTTIGVQGLEFADSTHLSVADGAQDFAASTLQLLSNPRRARERARCGREFALERYTWRDLAGRLLDFWRRAARS